MNPSDRESLEARARNISLKAVAKQADGDDAVIAYVLAAHVRELPLHRSMAGLPLTLQDRIRAEIARQAQPKSGKGKLRAAASHARGQISRPRRDRRSDGAYPTPQRKRA